MSGGLVLPTVADGNRPFWDGCREGVLRLQRCGSCDLLRYPVSTVCPLCTSGAAAWEAVSGRGVVYSFAVFRHAYNDAWRDRVPYVVALVELEEGPTMISNVVGAPPEDVFVGQEVTVVFEAATAEISVPQFTPVPA
jgi:hypothetical protein